MGSNKIRRRFAKESRCLGRIENLLRPTFGAKKPCPLQWVRRISGSRKSCVSRVDSGTKTELSHNILLIIGGDCASSHSVRAKPQVIAISVSRPSSCATSLGGIPRLLCQNFLLARYSAGQVGFLRPRLSRWRSSKSCAQSSLRVSYVARCPGISGSIGFRLPG